MSSTGTLQARWYSQVDREPDRRALGSYSFDGELQWIAGAELHRRALGAAGWLRGEGLGTGDVCVLALPSGERCAVLLLGALVLGAIPLVVAPPAIQGGSSHQAEVLLRIIRRTGAKVVVADDSFEEAHRELQPIRKVLRYLGAGHELPQGSPATPHGPRDTDTAAYQLTSGTTGFPRVCAWPQHAMAAALDGMSDAMRLGSDDVCVNWTPLYHDMGLVNNFFLCLTRGVPLVLLSPLDFVKRPALWLRALSDSQATLTWSPNFGFALAAERVRDDEVTGVRLARVRAFWNAAERIHYETMLAFHRRFWPLGVRFEALKTNFGCAENVGGATFSDPDGNFRVERVQRAALYERGVAEPAADGAADVVTVVGAGHPCPGINIAILSRTGRPLPEGHVGEVALQTPSGMVGYVRDAKATRRAIRGPYVRTGDLGYLRGRELFWTGRVRERITIRGRKLDPSDFEPVLLNVEGLRRGCFVAFGVDDARRGTQRIVVASELRDGAADATRLTREIQSRVLRELGIALDDVVLLPRGTLTKTTSGKRRHRAFREQYQDGSLEALRVRSGR